MCSPFKSLLYFCLVALILSCTIDCKGKQFLKKTLRLFCKSGNGLVTQKKVNKLYEFLFLELLGYHIHEYTSDCPRFYLSLDCVRKNKLKVAEFVETRMKKLGEYKHDLKSVSDFLESQTKGGTRVTVLTVEYLFKEHISDPCNAYIKLKSKDPEGKTMEEKEYKQFKLQYNTCNKLLREQDDFLKAMVDYLKKPNFNIMRSVSP